MNISSEVYKKLANSNTRELEVKVVINNIEYIDEVVNLNIQGSLPTKDVVIGQTPSLRVSVVLRGYIRFSSKATIKPYVRFVTDDEESEWLALGNFNAEAPSYQNNQTSVTGYDRMLSLDEEFISNISYPCLIKDLFDEILFRYQISSNFVCNEYTINGVPIGYTARQLLGYIASLHGGNAVFNGRGQLEVVRFRDVVDTIDLANCFAQSTDDTPFKIKQVTAVNGIKEYSYGTGTDFETLSFENPFVNNSSITDIGKVLVNVTVSNLTIEKQGTGLYLLGERIQTKSNTDLDTTLYIIVSEIELEFGNGGFVETIKSFTRTEGDDTYTKASTLNKQTTTIAKQLTEYVYSYTNDYALSLGNSAVTLLSLKVTSDYQATPWFLATINLNVTKAGTFDFKYYFTAVLHHIQPKVTLDVGYHIITLMLPLEFEANSNQSLVVTGASTDGEAIIDRYNVQAMIRGQGLAANGDRWDGNLELSTNIQPFNINLQGLSLDHKLFVIGATKQEVSIPDCYGYSTTITPTSVSLEGLSVGMNFNYTVSTDTIEEE